MKYKLFFLCFISIIALNSCKNEIITCEITSPKDSDEFWRGEEIPVTVEATSNKGAIIQVQVFLDDNLMGSLTEPPFHFIIPTDTLSARIYYLTAAAYSSSNREVHNIFVTIKE